MREIKFREVFLKNSDNTFSFFSYWGLINNKYEHDPRCFMGQTQSNMGHRVANNQYTGLKDKNGVEIYEGDISENYWGGRGEVVFQDGKFVVDYGKAITVPILYEVSKVIGNIYQDKELLKEDNQ